MCVRTVVVGVASLLIPMLFSPVAIVAQIQEKRGCSVETNTAVISSHLSSTFSPDDDIVKDVFANDRALLLAHVLATTYPERKVPLSAEVVFAFSTRDKTLLLFFKHSCLVAGFSTSFSAYILIQAKMRERSVS